jgi:hypothetical protein
MCGKVMLEVTSGCDFLNLNVLSRSFVPHGGTIQPAHRTVQPISSLIWHRPAGPNTIYNGSPSILIPHRNAEIKP